MFRASRGSSQEDRELGSTRQGCECPIEARILKFPVRRRGVVLSSKGLERFYYARQRANQQSRRRPTLADCAERAELGLRTLTRCLRAERVDRRSVERLLFSVGLKLQPEDLAD